jgi:catechol-2,3-dioxygenase
MTENATGRRVAHVVLRVRELERAIAFMDHTVCQSVDVTDPDSHEIEVSVDADPSIWRDDPAKVSGIAPLQL